MTTKPLSRYLVARRWPEGVHCPRCGNTDLYDASSYKPFHWQCRECAADGYRFSALAGTIFENTKKPLRDWFRVAHLMLGEQEGNERPPNPTHDGLRELRDGPFHVSQNPRGTDCPGAKAWRYCRDRRHMDRRQGQEPPLEQAQAQCHQRQDGVDRAIERQGNVVVRVLKRVNSQTMLDFVNETVSNKVSLLATDFGRDTAIIFATCRTKKLTTIAANTLSVRFTRTRLKAFGSIFKRGVVGTFHKMSAKYMPLYVAEFQFRYNNRFNPAMFDTAIAGC